MDEHRFRPGRAFAESGRAFAANAGVIVVAAVLLLAAPMAARIYFDGPASAPRVGMKIDAPPAKPVARATDAEPATLAPIQMDIDGGREALAWAAPMALAVLFDGFVALAVLDHSARRERTFLQRLWRATACLPSLLLIHLFWIFAMTVGLFVLVLPVAAVASGLAAAGPVRMMEDLRPVAAITRSLRLGWRRFWPMTMMAAAWLALQGAALFLTPIGAPEGTLIARAISLCAAPLAIAGLRTLSATMSAALYIELTRHERGVAITRLEKVFA